MEKGPLEQLRAGWYRLGGLRTGYSKSSRHQDLLSEPGMAEHLRVPRDRDGHYQLTILARYYGRQEGVNRLVREMFLPGVSTRKVEAVLMPLLDIPLSPQSVPWIVLGTISRFSAAWEGEPLAEFTHLG